MKQRPNIRPIIKIGSKKSINWFDNSYAVEILKEWQDYNASLLTITNYRKEYFRKKK